MIVVLLGPPGSGKGTQAEFLSDELGFSHFDTGAVLRAEVATGSDLGQTISQFIDHGRLVPLEVIEQVISKFLGSTDAERILFDGFPRNMEQAGVLERSLAHNGLSLDHVIFFDIETNKLLSRIINRRYCANCNSIYNTVHDPPTVDGTCDECGAHDFIQRKDDTEEVFGTRLKVYQESTFPLLEHYRELGKLRTVDADAPIEEVSESVEEIIRGRRHGEA